MDGGGFDEDFDFGIDDDPWPSFDAPVPPLIPPKQRFRMPSNDRYNNAYGSYRGGYGPGGGFGPPLGFRGPGPRGPGPRGPGPRGPYGPPAPMGPPPHMMFGRGFGPGGPPPPRNPVPENRAFRYLLRCGVTRESIKNLPKQMLMIMDPQYCGVCGLEFDSFVMSRMHYTSRNHAKNQRKWITQNTEHTGFQSNKQIPLKARELYCELCDVHITSVTHAESHYAGKPHRSIVEGKKNPKNPFLLQRGMEDRIQQLLRREKKHITTEKTAEVTAEAEAKTTQPELYCDICKTSVTCSEQMTMHLNGKKHLTKEKQHIIRVMNGMKDGEKEGGDGEAAPTGTVEEKNGGNGKAAPTGTEGQAEDGDWGNGSGTWEDT